MFLMVSSLLYARIAHGAHTERALAAHQVHVYSALSFAMSLQLLNRTP